MVKFTYKEGCRVMDKEILKKSLIFKNMDDNQIEKCLQALNAREKNFEKSSIILGAGQITESMGLVLSGNVNIESYDIYGNRTILSNINPGHIFAETYAILKNEPMLVSVVANEDSKVLMLNITNLQHIINAKEDWSTKLLMNLLMISSNKNLILSNKIFTNSPKTIREKVLIYLNFISLKKNSNEFNIPFNRKQLADYLNIDRSCLSNELGKMQKEGLITTKKSHFIIHKNATK